MKLSKRVIPPSYRSLPCLRYFHAPSHDHQAQCMQLTDNIHTTTSTLHQYQADLYSPVDALRRVLLCDVRPLLSRIAMRSTTDDASLALTPVQFPVTGNMLPLHTFRHAMASRPYNKNHRRLLREQLLRCETPRDILRVFAVALQYKESTQELARIDQSIVRALYRARPKATDAKILETINVIVNRFKHENLPLRSYFLAIGIKFAARARSLPGMKRYLKLYHDLGYPMSKGLFTAIIAKFSVGSQGLGEIRNGRWSRQDLLEVLLGTNNHPNHTNHDHLAPFLDRQTPVQLHAWLTVLSRCKAADTIWEEWLLWLQNPHRLDSQVLQKPSRLASTKARGDHWFIESMADAGDIRRAWIILKDSGFPYKDCRLNVRKMLMQEIQHATVLDGEMHGDLLQLYAYELDRVEKALGVEWISLEDGQGYHRPTALFQQQLEELSSPLFKRDTDYGYPHDSIPDSIETYSEDTYDL